MKPSRVIPLVIFVAVLSFMVGQCSYEVPWHKSEVRLERNPQADLPHRELKRVTSPDGVIDAILAEVITDSLSANAYAVYLAPAGTKLDLQSDVFERKAFYANRIDGLELVWKEPKFLEVRYERGDIFGFQNYYWLRSDYIVEVRIVPQSKSFSLSK
jgi:hypothetical protein